jgi:ubiquitin-protein ligase
MPEFEITNSIDFLGQFCHEILKKTAKWSNKVSLVDVIKAVIQHIDEPDIDLSLSPRSFLYFYLSRIYSFSDFLELGTEYMENRPEFRRKAFEFVKKYALKRT